MSCVVHTVTTLLHESACGQTATFGVSVRSKRAVWRQCGVQMRGFERMMREKRLLPHPHHGLGTHHLDTKTRDFESACGQKATFGVSMESKRTVQSQCGVKLRGFERMTREKRLLTHPLHGLGACHLETETHGFESADTQSRPLSCVVHTWWVVYTQFRAHAKGQAVADPPTPRPEPQTLNPEP